MQGNDATAGSARNPVAAKDILRALCTPRWMITLLPLALPLATLLALDHNLSWRSTTYRLIGK